MAVINNRKIIFLTVFFALTGCAVAFLCILIFSVGIERTNPPVAAEPNWDSPRTRELFMRTCGDCHSNETTWPWYSKIPPVSLLVANDVEEGRAVFNISNWGSGENEGDEAGEVYREGEMPPGIFLIMHPEARLSTTEREELLHGLVATFGGESGEDEGD